MKRRYLVVGGTGMLAPFCQSLPSAELIIAARFTSNKANLATFSDNVEWVELDYNDEHSNRQFLNSLSKYKHLDYCILWIHSPAHCFSCKIIKILTELNRQIHIIHLFGSATTDATCVHQCAKAHKANFTPIRLGSIQEEQSNRWMTHAEISQTVIDVIKAR